MANFEAFHWNFSLNTNTKIGRSGYIYTYLHDLQGLSHKIALFFLFVESTVLLATIYYCWVPKVKNMLLLNRYKSRWLSWETSLISGHPNASLQYIYYYYYLLHHQQQQMQSENGFLSSSLHFKSRGKYNLIKILNLSSNCFVN